jgi:hypothetical protein
VSAQDLRQDVRRQFLLFTAAFGFVFFSISLNKLPGYILPLAPALFAAIGASFERRNIATLSRWWYFSCAILIGLIAVVASILPPILAGSKLSWALFHITRAGWFYILIPMAVVLVGRRSWLPVLMGLCVVTGGIYLKQRAYPVLDRTVSARGFWRGLHQPVCDAGLHRAWQYGLAFYKGEMVPQCSGKADEAELTQRGNEVPQIAVHNKGVH